MFLSQGGEPIGLTQTEFESYIENNASEMVSAPVTMGAVVSSKAAMGTVSGSQTAMGAVSGSLIARTAAIGSQYAIDTLWSATVGSETWLNGYQVQSGGEYQRLVDGPTGNGKAVEMDIQSTAATSRRGWTVDPDNYDTLEWKDRVPDSNYNGGPTHIRVKLNGNVIYKMRYENNTSPSWTNRSVDISGYSDEGDLIVEADTSWGRDTVTITAQFGDITLS